MDIQTTIITKDFKFDIVFSHQKMMSQVCVGSDCLLSAAFFVSLCLLWTIMADGSLPTMIVSAAYLPHAHAHTRGKRIK